MRHVPLRAIPFIICFIHLLHSLLIVLLSLSLKSHLSLCACLPFVRRSVFSPLLSLFCLFPFLAFLLRVFYLSSLSLPFFLSFSLSLSDCVIFSYFCLLCLCIYYNTSLSASLPCHISSNSFHPSASAFRNSSSFR